VRNRAQARSAFGRETRELLDIQAKKYGFEVVHEQTAQWRQIASLKPDW